MANTTFKGSYWDRDGKYQKQYDMAWEQLIPASGEAKDGLPEALRAISRIGYDYYNNGFCNLWNRWEEDEFTMDSYYEDLVDYLAYHVPRDMHRELTTWLPTQQTQCTWGRGGDDVIDRIIDHIMEQIIEAELIDTEAVTS